MAGRRPVPDQIKDLTGSHNPRNNASPVFHAVENVKPMKVVERDAHATEEWNRLIGELIDNKLLTRASVSIFAAYCMAYAQWMHAEDHIAEHGMWIMRVVLNKKGEVVDHVQEPSPALAIANRARLEMLRYAVEFGITPAAATRVHATPTGKDESGGLDAFMNRREKSKDETDGPIN